MAIARNKPANKARREEDIAAFAGQAADPTPQVAVPDSIEAETSNDGPKSFLVRWAGHEALRDQITEFSHTERYSAHAVVIRALRLGMTAIENGAGMQD